MIWGILTDIAWCWLIACGFTVVLWIIWRAPSRRD